MGRGHLSAAAVLAAVSSAAAAVATQEGEAGPNIVYDPALYQAMDYRSIGPARGGRVTAVAGVRDEIFTFYMGSTGGGVWKTTDAGTTWNNVSDGFFAVGSIGAIAVAPSDRNTIYVGTGSACPRGNISVGKGVYRSLDAGRTWSFVGLPEAGQIGAIVVHPSNSELVYVAALGNIFGPNPQRGVFRSRDGGASWEKVLFLSDQAGAIDLAMDPTNPRVIYAGMWRFERKPWTLINGGEEGGVYKTVDGGDTWKRLGGGLPAGVLGKVGIAVSPANPERVWVLQQHAEEKKGGLYRSDDSGSTWQRVNRDHKLRQRGWYYSHVFADPQDQDTVYAENIGFYRSTDGGKTFDDRITVPHGDNHDLWINPDHPQIMINSNDGGANVTLNGGESWSTQHNQPTAEFYRVAVDNDSPYRVYAAQQDNSTISVPSRTPGGITPAQHWYAVGGGESGHIAVDPRNSDVIYAGTYSGEVTRLDRALGFTRQITEYPHYTEGWEMRDLKYRFQWNAPLLISHHDPDVVYHVSQYVHRTRNGGQTWEIISPDLTRADDEYLGIPGGPVRFDATGVEVYASIFAFAESPHRQGELWAGSDDGLVHLSRDGGGSWSDITPSGMPSGGTVNAIELSTHAAGRAFLAVYKYRENDARPYIFGTDDYGDSWRLLTRVAPGSVAAATRTNGIPADHFVRVVREDPDRKGLLYAGTEFGVYVSFDDGARWQSLQLDLPITPITDMVVHGKDLVLSTQGRSFWILDDLTPLHQLDASVADDDAHLFAPRTALRTQLRGFGGSPIPDPIPRGAEIFFTLRLPPDSEEPVRLEILDPSGEVIRVYSTHADIDAGEEALEVDAGMNVVDWDLLYPGPYLVSDLVTMVMSNPQPGPVAPTGVYEIRLSVGDWQQTQPLELGMDPRWEVTDSDLQQQFDLALRIRDMITET